jgi:two-component system, LytTR family, response regulator
MAIRALIVDDEPLARRRLTRLLRESADVEIVGQCQNGAEAIEAIRRESPDLVFLDVQMPGLDGFGVLEAMNGDRLPLIVFVTAYDQYAIQAFEAQAVDYLLKPFSRERFDKMMVRVRSAAVRADADRLARQVLELLTRYRHGGDALRLVARSVGRVSLVNVDEVNWIQAEGNYVRVHTARESQLVRETLSALATRLPARFRRIHRSIIVNADHVKELQPGLRGDYAVILRDGTRLRFSRRFRHEWPEIFGMERGVGD